MSFCEHIIYACIMYCRYWIKVQFYRNQMRVHAVLTIRIDYTIITMQTHALRNRVGT